MPDGTMDLATKALLAFMNPQFIDTVAEALEKRRLRQDPQSTRRIMFWSSIKVPQTYVGRARGVDLRKREAVVHALRAGKRVEAYMGLAECRTCGKELGAADQHESTVAQVKALRGRR
jgi:hypothetical protein